MGTTQKPINFNTMSGQLEENLRIGYGVASIPIGNILIGFSMDDGNSICHLHFTDNASPEGDIALMRKRWPKAQFVKDSELAKRIAKSAFAAADADISDCAVEVTACGTPFQQRVWEALVRVPYGTTCTYAELAVMLGNPKAVRAVANAVANNEIAVLIPCHRVVSKNGDSFKYRWGSGYKRKLLEYEQTRN